MIDVPGRMNEPAGSGRPCASTGDTSSRSRTRGGKLAYGALATLPPSAGAGLLVPVPEAGAVLGPVTGVAAALGCEPPVTWLLVTSTGMSRMEPRSSRRTCGQRR